MGKQLHTYLLVKIADSTNVYEVFTLIADGHTHTHGGAPRETRPKTSCSAPQKRPLNL